MEQNLKCPLCQKNIYSGIGVGCNMCGMLLEDKDELFCSEKCSEIYGEIYEYETHCKMGFERI